MGLTFDKNTYFAKPKSDVKDKIQVEIGDSKQENFYPQVKIMRWDNEVNFSARLVHDEKTPIVTTLSDKVIWEGEKTATHFYEIQNEEHPEGAHEFEVVLKEKPLSNKVEFTINTKGLDFFYQPELTQAEIDQGASRPENVVGSYAVYYKNCPVNYVGGKEYKVGKFCHIYRPQIIDAKGNKVWGELAIDEQAGILTVTIPQEFLDKAVYPVLVDPTFGYTTAGGSTFTGDNRWGTRYTISENGTLTSISAYGSLLGSTNRTLYLILNLTSDGSVIASLTTTLTTSDNTNAWKTISASSQNLTNGTDYVLSSESEAAVQSYWVGRYDSNATPYWIQNSATYPPQNPWTTHSNGSGVQVSIYATYTASGGDTIWTVALV